MNKMKKNMNSNTKWNKFVNNTQAVTPTYEYIILIGILIVYITLFLTIYADEFGIAPLRIAMQTQFEDIGNDISSKVVDMYIIAPESGYLKTKFYMPQAVGKYEYKVEFKEIGLDQQILVSALRFEKEVMITLNKIGSSLGLTGSTYSSTPEHWLIYSMSSQYDLTPIAVAYPREVSYNLTSGWSDIVVFDGSDSKGIGELQYKWDFNGDGIVDATNATEYYQYSAPGVYNATLTIYDPILDREASTTVQVNVTTSYIEPSIDAYKYVSPRSFGVGKPSYTTIVLYGKGIPQNESHIDVMQVIDVSGSMDPDWLKIAGGDPETGYTPFSNKSIKGTAGSKIWTESFSLTSAANETIEKLHVELWNVSGSNNVDLYVKPPGGIAERAQTITPWYERYEKANPPLGSYTIYVLGDFPVGSQSFKVNVNKTSKISISGAVDTYTWSNTTYNLNVAKWMETYITWPTSSVDLNLYLTDPSSATYAPTSANLSSPSRNWERIYLTNIKAGDWTVAVYNNGSYPTYNVTIQAWCIEENKDPKVDITMDGSSTGKKTPHTFTGLTGTHTFTVPSSDSKGHQFWKWNETGSTSRTISVSSSGTYTAVYRQPPPTPTPTPTFTISNPGEQTVYRGSSKSISITVTSYYGYNKEVSLNASGMPSGTTITFTPDKKTPTFSSTMTINVSASTPTGNYPITIIGTGSDGLVKTQTFTLYIPDFSISASPSSGSVKTTGGSTNYTITLTSLYKFAGSISLSISGLPAGASATFSPNPVSLSAGQTKTSTLTVSVPPGTPVGDYTLTITGISGSLSHSTSVTLKVIIPPPGLLYWLARLYEISLPSPWISARAAPGVESFTGYIRLGETPVTNFSGHITASEPPRWDNTESPILINESIENFKISLNYYDEYGNESLHFWVSKNGAPPVLVAGLMGEYYDNMDLTNLKLTRLDPVVDFNWGSGSPHSSIEADTFSVRWTGYVKVDRSETYTFYVVTDDGSRVWVDDTLIIDSWINQSATERSGSIYLAEGWHKIKYEYYENTGSATARLLYSSPSTPKQVIPQDHLSPVNMKGNVCINYTETNVIAPATYTIYITGTFLSGTKDFELQTYMAKLDAARISGKTFEDMLNSSSDKSGLVSFGGNATIINQSDVRLIQSLTYSHSLVKAGFDLLEAHNGTPVGEAIYVAVQELNNSSEFFTENDRTRVPVIILLSDGLPTLPATLEEISENNYTRAIQYALEQANIAKSMGILIYAIGFGVDADMNFLANISSGEGFYFFAATKEELQAIYLQIVKELREYAGRNVVITDVVPAGINVVSAPGASEIINNDDGTTTIIWRVGGVKIYRHGQTPLVRRLVISTMSTGSTNANVYGLSNVTYTNVITGDLTTFVFPETNIYVKPVGSGQMSME